MSERVPPRRRPTIGAQVCAAPRSQLDLEPVAYGLPLELPVDELVYLRLDDFIAGHAKKEREVGGGEVEPVAALEADDVGFVLDELDRPPGLSGVAVAALADGLFVVVGDEVLVEVAPQLHRPGGVE